jgi:hypothetical protein
MSDTREEIWNPNLPDLMSDTQEECWSRCVDATIRVPTAEQTAAGVPEPVPGFTRFAAETVVGVGSSTPRRAVPPLLD